MSAALMIDAGSSSAASSANTEAQAGELWGVDLGTTSSSSAYSAHFCVIASWTRISNLQGAMPEGMEELAVVRDIESFSAGTIPEQLWYLHGKAVAIP